MAQRARSRSELDMDNGLDADVKGRVYTSSERPPPVLMSTHVRRSRTASHPPPTTSSWALSNKRFGSPTQYSYPRRRNKSEGAPWEGSTSCTSTIASSTSVDPFNLITFFPTPTQMRSEEGSAFGGGNSGGEWDWLSEESSVNNEEYDGEMGYEFKEGLLIESEDKMREVGFTDDVAGQVIDGEDKFGMLELTSGKIARILIGDIGSLLGRLTGARRVVNNRDYEPEDMEEVC